MSNKIVKINMQLEKLEQQKKELLEKKRKEETEKLIEIGRTVVKYMKIEDVDTEILKEAMESYCIPILENRKAEKNKGIAEQLAKIETIPESDGENA